MSVFDDRRTADGPGDDPVLQQCRIWYGGQWGCLILLVEYCITYRGGSDTPGDIISNFDNVHDYTVKTQFRHSTVWLHDFCLELCIVGYELDMLGAKAFSMPNIFLFFICCK